MSSPEISPIRQSDQQLVEATPLSQEMLDKIQQRTNSIIAGFLNIVRSDEDYNKKSSEEAKINPERVWKIEASSLMQAIAAITTSVIVSIHNNGVDINELINDHFRSVNTYLKQAVKENEAKRGSLPNVEAAEECKDEVKI